MKISRYPFIIAVSFGVSLMAFLSCSRWFKPAAPKLAVVIVVDQLRFDYLTRYAGLFSGGFAKLLAEGAIFTNAHQDHAATETAPGHATLLTGSFPSHHGIIANEWLLRGASRQIYSVDDSNFALVISPTFPNQKNIQEDRGKSPQKLLRHTLGDWLKAKAPQAKVISIAGKDRSAILMAGFEADAAYWFSSAHGAFVSSRYYLEALPDWVSRWNEARPADRFYRQAWEKSRPEENYFLSREDLFAAESDGEHTTFPHSFINPEEADTAAAAKINSRFYDWMMSTPFLDRLTLEFAQQALQAEQLGADATPDLLLVSLAATDYIGHSYGPLSQECEDQLLRLDVELAKFFAALDRKVGLKNCVIALSADHGVLPLPEELRRRGFEAARILRNEALEEVKSVERELQEEWRTTRPIFRTYLGEINLDYHIADSLNMTPAAFRARVAVKLRSLSFVHDIFTYDELQAADGAGRAFIEKQRRSFHPERSPDLLMQLKPHYLVTSRLQGTTHGSPYEYDSHVPLIFWGARIKAGRFDTPQRTVDLAPTLAHLLNLEFPADLQNRVRQPRPGSAAAQSAVDGEVLHAALNE